MAHAKLSKAGKKSKGKKAGKPQKPEKPAKGKLGKAAKLEKQAKKARKGQEPTLGPAEAKALVEKVAASYVEAEAAEFAPVPVGSLGSLLRLEPGVPVDLAGFDAGATPGVGSRAQAEAQLPGLSERLSALQERLYADAVGAGSQRRVLLVLQGMDTSGKGGTVRHVVGQLDPNGIRIKAFKAPTEAELAHDFLWRVRSEVPEPGHIGIFDRSQYEDVLVAKVRKLALPMHIGRRYAAINKFEQGLVDEGCVVIKCFLHISPQEQRERLLARLEDPDKRWKYNPGDVDDRLLWPQFQDAYKTALERCGTEAAPWHLIPADRKWYRNYAVMRLLIEALEDIDPQFPPGSYDLAAERARVLAS